MVEANPIQWLNPSTWPWVIYAWILFALLGAVRPAWNWFRRRRAAEWAVGDGRIESSIVSEPSFSSTTRQGHYIAELHYSYFAVGSRHYGCYKRAVPTESEADGFVGNLEGLAVSVRYDPENPSRSLILKGDVETLLQRRGPLSAANAPTSGVLAPDSLRPFLWLLAFLSLLGLFVSLWVHVNAALGRRVAPESFFWILHVGIFVVWLPAVYIAQRFAGNLHRRDFWKVMLADSPAWTRYMVNGFAGYALVNFLLFIANAPKSYGGSPPPLVWRGFSGHWMAFYSAAFAIIYAAIRREKDSRRSEAPLS